ncbi:PrsW family intramembrane metalloprotease [Salarchaeum sp. JOR-1]|uniref:PrsW family intramembrane metalloprotease n=1 Tax=Salarchaeum sp. JOR-1 TaxID=2599399 RepID=UPI00119860A7|nr:PrsW family glutamic-type intramembrane protease [Salarchaeum sp. JOR-1]QDX39918.1 PrsW family intramembrane metalloprotease [Salarchaeum sp. JOR-1]
MSEKRDPVQRAATGDRDLYDVTDWEVRTALDRAAVAVYDGLVTSSRYAVVLLALLVVFTLFAASLGFVFLERPYVAAYVVLSVLPALGLVAYVWHTDVTTGEPLPLLAATFSLGFLFAGFAAVLNTLLQGAFALAGITWMVVVFYLVVGPVEETVKLLAVRLYAYRSDRFDAVVDGAVYGAVAGLGFATIENAIYIGRDVLQTLQATGVNADVAVLQIAAVRTFAGPGHVIYSAFAGYYLGLAKFNPDNKGPIVVKGLLVAALIHATYNTAVSNLHLVYEPLALAEGPVFLAFVVLYDGVFFFLLVRKLKRYGAAYEESGAARYDRGDTDLKSAVRRLD